MSCLGLTGESVVTALPSAWLDHKAFKPDSYQGKPRHLPDDLKAELQEMVDKILAHIEWLPDDRKILLLDACLSVSPINCSWQQHAIAAVAVWQVQTCLAQGIEAQSATTAGRGPQDESPTPLGDALNINHLPHDRKDSKKGVSRG